MNDVLNSLGEVDGKGSVPGFKHCSQDPMNGEGMPHSSRVVLFVGTRPEIIKTAPVYHAFKSAGIEPLIIHGGQHGAVTYLLYEFFDMHPAISLLIARSDSRLPKLTEQLLP